MGFIKFKLPDTPILRSVLAPILALKEPKHMVAFGVLSVLAVSFYIHKTSTKHYGLLEKLFMLIMLSIALLMSATLIGKL